MSRQHSTFAPVGAQVLVVAIVAWGALAFGSVYPWAYWPLLGASAVVGAIAAADRPTRRRIPKPIAIGLLVLVGAVLLQLVPLPAETLARISPATNGVIARYTFQPTSHPLSIDPHRTLTGLAFIAGLGLLLIGLIAILDEAFVLGLVRAVIVLGLVAAVLAIVQKGGGNGKIYGFWQPRSSPATPFGPFVNPNHFAGWMLMSVTLGLGHFVALVVRATADGKRSWRARVAWLSTPAASRLIVTGFALAVMTTSVLFSGSRSGIGCLAVASLGLGAFAVRKLAGRSRRSIVALYLGVAAVVCVGCVGPDRLVVRFQDFQHEGFGDRTAVWRDAWTVARTFPVAGTGLDTFSVAMLFFQTRDLKEHFAEAHSDYLQVAAEGGLLVSAAALLLILLAAREVRRRFAERRDSQTTYWIRAGAVTGLLAIALQECGEFSLQMPGNAALFSVLAAIAIHRRPVDSPGRTVPGRRVRQHAALL